MNMKIEVLEVIEEDDGSATIKFDMSDDVVNLFIRQGIKHSLGELKDSYMVVPVEDWEDWVAKGVDVPKPRTYEMTSQEAQAFFQIGTLQAIKDGIEAVGEKIKDDELVAQMELPFNNEEVDDGC